jgi:hypothetical protein
VQFGDYIMMHVQALRGNVSSQGFSNPCVYLQIVPDKHHECFTRNKRDFMWQICPKLVYDARRDFQSSLKMYEKMFNNKGGEDGQENE